MDIMTRFIPQHLHKYEISQYRESDNHRVRISDRVPSIFQNRPVHAIQLMVYGRGYAKYFGEGDVVKVDATTFLVTSSMSNPTKQHTVRFAPSTATPPNRKHHCSCTAWAQEFIPCRHIFAVIAAKNNSLTLRDLPEMVLSSNEMKLDLPATTTTTTTTNTAPPLPSRSPSPSPSTNQNESDHPERTEPEKAELTAAQRAYRDGQRTVRLLKGANKAVHDKLLSINVDQIADLKAKGLDIEIMADLESARNKMEMVMGRERVATELYPKMRNTMSIKGRRSKAANAVHHNLSMKKPTKTQAKHRMQKTVARNRRKLKKQRPHLDEEAEHIQRENTKKQIESMKETLISHQKDSSFKMSGSKRKLALLPRRDKSERIKKQRMK